MHNNEHLLMQTGAYRGIDDFKQPKIDDPLYKLDEYSHQVGKLLKINDIILQGNQMLRNRIETARKELL